MVYRRGKSIYRRRKMIFQQRKMVCRRRKMAFIRCKTTCRHGWPTDLAGKRVWRGHKQAPQGRCMYYGRLSLKPAELEL